MDYKQLAQTTLEIVGNVNMNGSVAQIEKDFVNVINPVRAFLWKIINGELCECDKADCGKECKKECKAK